ncbi:MAG TPA: zinc ribbon domain-containing protein [Blastocatellia bacterium]|nr:zinc ribbon domain-containing protein [Blastocatellia bacterium]
MFCPKCGAEALDGQRFCKSCGTNLQLINNALRGGEGGQSFYGVDLEALKQNAAEFAKSWKEGWSGSVGPGIRAGIMRGHTTRDIKRRERDEVRRRNLPRPKDWLAYSWQHNLRNGLMSLFSGAGLGVLLYYLGQNLVGWGAFNEIPHITEKQLEIIQHVAGMAWMLSIFPIVKGGAQIIYASFFAESMKTLSERFTVQLEPEQEQRRPARPPEPVVTSHPSLETPPASVTEHTTEIFEPATAKARRETQ